MRDAAAPAKRDEAFRQKAVYLIRRKTFEFDSCHFFSLTE